MGSGVEKADEEPGRQAVTAADPVRTAPRAPSIRRLRLLSAITPLRVAS
jgi:hypothetical protein